MTFPNAMILNTTGGIAVVSCDTYCDGLIVKHKGADLKRIPCIPNTLFEIAKNFVAKHLEEFASNDYESNCNLLKQYLKTKHPDLALLCWDHALVDIFMHSENLSYFFPKSDGYVY